MFPRINHAPQFSIAKIRNMCVRITRVNALIGKYGDGTDLKEKEGKSDE
jgi:hypothetical protein